MTSRKRKHIQCASFCGVFGQVFHRLAPAGRCGLVVGVEVAGDDRSGPAPDAGKDRYILLPIRTFVRYRLAYDPGTGLKLPEQLSGLCVDGLEPALHRSVKSDIAGCYESARPNRILLFYLPSGSVPH